MRTPPVGDHIDVGAVHLDVLGPASAFHGTRSDPNNSSLVLRAVVDGVRILLTGDAEIEAQQALLDSGVDLRADVLKVPHHGSAYSDPAFLAAVHARLAVVSVGAGNDYGQPSPVLLTEMARLGVPLLRTDRDGDVAVVRRDGILTAVVHGVGPSSGALSASVTARSDGREYPRSVRPAAVRERAAASQTDASVAGARMGAWHRVRSTSTICPTRCRAWSSWSATRTCWSAGPSARSPPPHVASTRPSR